MISASKIPLQKKLHCKIFPPVLGLESPSCLLQNLIHDFENLVSKNHLTSNFARHFYRSNNFDGIIFTIQLNIVVVAEEISSGTWSLKQTFIACLSWCSFLQVWQQTTHILEQVSFAFYHFLYRLGMVNCSCHIDQHSKYNSNVA